MFHIERAEIQTQLRALGIDPEHIRALHIQLQHGALDQTAFVIPTARLRLPKKDDVVWPEALDRQALTQRGEQLLRDDRLVVFWLGGGAATRYFDLSKVTPAELDRYGQVLEPISATMSALPKGMTPVLSDLSYFELKIRNLLLVTKRLQLDVHPQVIIMTSFLTDEQTRAHVTQLFQKYPDLDQNRFHFIVQQPRIPRFTKVADLKNIDLFIDGAGQLSFAPCGHGDFVYLLQEYLKHTHLPNVEYMFFANVDNLAATIEPWLLGLHAQSGHGRTVELVAKQPGDQGGMPCFVDNQLVILEQMKFPDDFDTARIPWFNTNTFWFSLDALLQFSEDLPFVLAEKTIAEGDVIQLERFACDVNVSSQYIVLPRAQRFWPVKRYVDLLSYHDATTDTQLHRAFTQLLHNNYDLL